MSDEIIIQHLKEKESQLLNELNKVRMALKAFIDDNINFNNNNNVENTIPTEYSDTLTYSSKVLYILAREKQPMLVDEIVQAISQAEPGIDMSKLHKNVSYNLSMLVKYARVKKHAFQRKVKYSLH
jgi:hypothetical protein